MIVQATAADHDFIVEVAQETPAHGVLLEVNWRLKTQNPRMPYTFYRMGNEAVLQLSGGTATICGTPEDIAEAEAFLSFCGVRQLAAGWVPAGWYTAQNKIMRRSPGQPLVPAKTSLAIDTAPPVQAVLELLGEEEWLAAGPQSDFYANSCIRRHHGFAEIYGIWHPEQPARLAATAGVYAVTAGCAHISNVYTHAALRGKGFAGGLLHALCAAYRARQVTLCCLPKLEPFYARFGFATVGRSYFSSPAEV